MASIKILEAARQRRTARAAASDVKIQWFIKEVSDKVTLTMRKRIGKATELVKSRVVLNISRPVTKRPGKISKRIVVSNRSKPGEFPKADTTQLMKTIFGTVKQTRKGVWDGFIGTPLDYGAILETNKRLNRSFLMKTLNQERSKVAKILTGPIK